MSSFLQTSIKPKNINEKWYYIGFGLNYKSMFKKRTNDILGIAVVHSGINNDIGSETAIELTYKAQLGKNFFIQPDLQYIINPAGTDTKLKNCLLAFLRFGINFSNKQ
ncbi:MAG TPA: carbohydrate porin [Bacteroidales bacterium]|nr:carbohydrate porin [Bacteroidales bacterium]